MRTKLSKRAIDALAPGSERYTAFDTDVAGFAMRVSPDGSKSYGVKYRFGARQRWFTIGRHGSPWTPDSARKEALRVLGEVAHGFDPAEKRAVDRRAITFAQLCELYLEEGCAHKKASTLGTDRGRIDLHLKPLLGSTRVDAITRADIEKLQIIVAKGGTAAKNPPHRPQGGKLASGGPGAARQCVVLAATVLQFAVDRGFRSDNPARGVKKPPTKQMQRFLSEIELARLGQALDQEEVGNPLVVNAIRLLALTGARRSEIEKLRWDNVDFERGLLTLDDSKTGSGKVIHLSPPALAILNDLPRVLGNEYVFPGRNEGRRSWAIGSVWPRVRASADLPGVRLHDLRHSFASVGATSFSLLIIGKLLGHSQAQTTARYAHLSSSPLKAANDAIGGRIAAAMGCQGGEVIALRRAR
jgi:integrase